MSARVALEERLEDVLPCLKVELSTCYTMKSRRAWPWLIRRGRHLNVDLLSAADFFDAAGKRFVAAELRARAELLLQLIEKQRALSTKLKEAVGQ